MQKRVLWGVAISIAFIILGFVGLNIYQITHPQSLFNNEAGEKELVETEADNEAVVEAMTQSEAEAEKPKAEIQQADIQPEPAPFSLDKVNILLLGLDKSLDDRMKTWSHRTDTIILAAVDFKEKKVDLISIPRDTYVVIPGYVGKARINSAFTLGGGINEKAFRNSMNTVSRLMGGVPIYYYVGVEMQMVIDVIDHMGGLEFEVDVPVDVAGRRFIEPGLQKLTGLQLLDYARHRHTRFGDIDRIARQQRLLMAIFDQMKSMDQLKNLPALYNDVKNNMHTNLSLKQIAALGLFAMELETQSFSMHSMPGYFLDMNGASYWGVDQKGRQALIKEIFDIEVPLEEEDRPSSRGRSEKKR